MTVLPQPLADADWLAAAIDRGDELVIADVRWRLADGPLRTEYERGHIPGAHSMPTAGNLGPDGRFLPPDALADRYRDHAEEGDVVVSCGSGVTACHDALAMAAAGFALPRLYPGSFSQWSAGEDRPVVTGPAATPTS